MPVLAYHHGPDWTQELYQATIDRAMPDAGDLPSGLIAHYAAPLEGGGWQVVDVWESAEDHDRFLRERVIPVAQELGAPAFQAQVTELYNSLVA
ncbi:hypothetical protein M2164_000221 [Streptomyces sp. SAI-208]|uniref:hypothetical protein n=1 Tax=Streptomyces sp. SAI-208 TaxID=2940550 RepID=UPI002473FCD4|nr:hypothetical protein [Streptomyces sp. SAI-208]MDH6604586.1 hypothetical protein [Streptomyces sp. SAI-208]